MIDEIVEKVTAIITAYEWDDVSLDGDLKIGNMTIKHGDVSIGVRRLNLTKDQKDEVHKAVARVRAARFKESNFNALNDWRL